MPRICYCINPFCQSRENKVNKEVRHCQSCQTSLWINQRYRLVKCLNEFKLTDDTEIFEIIDTHDDNKKKVLKIVPEEKKEELRNEFQALTTLRECQNIPLVELEDNNFFVKIKRQDTQETIRRYCLVMELIEGENLEQYLNKNNSISQKQAIEWLRQLVNIISYINKRHYFHRDIKPQNIMINDNKLTLIDFGSARNLTETYHEKLNNNQVQNIVSQGYTAPEQKEGKARPISDVFSLGRTFFYLLTGKEPYNVKEEQISLKKWRNQHKLNVENWLVELIDEMMLELPERRPSLPEILLRLERRNQYLKYQFLPILTINIVITILIIGLKNFGFLQTFELQIYDQMLRLRPPEENDSRILVVALTEENIKKYNPEGKNFSLPDEILTQLLKKLNEYQARVIGLDIYRANINISSDDAQKDNFFALCRIGVGDTITISSPLNIPKNRTGFSNVPVDPYGIIRRQFLGQKSDKNCPTSFSLSLRVALHYLQKEGFEDKFSYNNVYEISNSETNKKVVFERLKSNTGGYHLPEEEVKGYQILINYRSNQDFPTTFTLADVLENQVPPDLIKDKIVLIGTTAQTIQDYFRTPYSGQWKGEISGVVLQAQMVSNIISSVLDDRPLISGWSTKFGKTIWILMWSFLGALIGSFLVSRKVNLWMRIFIELGAIACLWGICFFSLIQGSWTSFVPALLVYLGTNITVVAYQSMKTIIIKRKSKFCKLLKQRQA